MNEELSMDLAKEQMTQELDALVNKVKRIMEAAEVTDDFDKVQAAYDALGECNCKLLRIVTSVG